MPPQPIPALREVRIESQATRDVVSVTRTSPAAFRTNIDLTQTNGSSLQKEVMSLNASAEQDVEFTREGPMILQDGKRLQRRSSNLSTASAASSFISLADSTFSMLSGSSKSSVQGPLGASERLAVLIFEHESLNPLCYEALTKVSTDRFERNLRRLIRLFSVDLQQEASNLKQSVLARHVKYMARNSALLVCNELDPERAGNKKDPGAEDSDNSDIDDPGDELADLREFETFIINSRAFETLVANLRQFVRPTTQRIVDLQDSELDMKTSQPLNNGSSSLSHIPPRLSRMGCSDLFRSVVTSLKYIVFKSPLQDGMKRVKWTCVRNTRAQKRFAD